MKNLILFARRWPLRIAVVLIFAGVLCLPASRISGQEPVSEERMKTDSLENILKSAEGRDRLELFEELIFAYQYAGDIDASLDALNRAIDEARKQKSDEHLVRLTRDRMLLFYNFDFNEEFFAEIPAAMAYLESREAWYDYFFLYKNKVFLYMYEGNYDKCQQEALEMYRLAREKGYPEGAGVAMMLLGELYYATNRFDESEEAFAQSEEILLGGQAGDLTDLYYYWSKLRFTRGQHREALLLCEKYEQVLIEYDADREAKGLSSNSASIWFELYLAYNQGYSNIGEYGKAEEYMRKAEASPFARHDTGKAGIWLKKAYMRYNQGRFDEAFANLDSLYMLDIRNGWDMSALQIMFDKAQWAYDQQIWETAADSYRSLYFGTDSLIRAEGTAKLEELRTVYEVDKLEAQKARQRLVIIYTTIGCVLLALVVLIYIIYSRRLRRKNLSLYRQIQENARNEKEVVKVLHLTPEEELSREMKLFRELNDLMENERPFTDPALDRAVLVRLLSTNDKYLADAVRDGAHTTVAAYISDYRLAYSLQMLSDSPDMPLDVIAADSGHGSYSAFFRAFIRKYGMSPSDYRKLSRSRISEGE